MRPIWIALIAVSVLPANPLPAQAETVDALSPQSGAIVLTEAQAQIGLSDDYSFYGPEDARTILVEIWENPPSQAENALGIVMPAGDDPRQQSWGAIITWEPIGWVDSDDARNTDYAGLMVQMQSAARALNAQRRAEGYPEVQVLGWAQEPRYDSVAHTVSWARELHFFDDEPNALHYDMRLLGRRGVLSMNIVGTMDQLAQIRAGAADLAGRTEFDSGARYEDFEAGRDDVAAYGVAGVVATGVGVAVAKNVGAMALLGKLLQPLGIALLVLGTAMLTPLRRLFSRKKPDN
ncbi:hypothetical protein CP97_14763 [Aurantiacibacter atlanticus]|uniref:DUF2167 domain-containing protein n=1 Tax=Aurantiacibacter atlanticus TaxID=1648404 RepID=A0A161J4B8_9SPHN|nr:DUF2167 domain-containing protein [Aurantiacibacter atlanticus]ANC50449.1 hypothetical protein CP97_14763 [Aurantiacibacter atlanticus]